MRDTAKPVRIRQDTDGHRAGGKAAAEDIVADAHAVDLLCQSYDRAREYFPDEILGKITDGKVHIGSHLTFIPCRPSASRIPTK